MDRNMFTDLLSLNDEELMKQLYQIYKETPEFKEKFVDVDVLLEEEKEIVQKIDASTLDEEEIKRLEKRKDILKDEYVQLYDWKNVAKFCKQDLEKHIFTFPEYDERKYVAFTKNEKRIVDGGGFDKLMIEIVRYPLGVIKMVATSCKIIRNRNNVLHDSVERIGKPHEEYYMFDYENGIYVQVNPESKKDDKKEVFDIRFNHVIPRLVQRSKVILRDYYLQFDEASLVATSRPDNKIESVVHYYKRLLQFFNEEAELGWMAKLIASGIIFEEYEKLIERKRYFTEEIIEFGNLLGERIEKAKKMSPDTSEISTLQDLDLPLYLNDSNIEDAHKELMDKIIHAFTPGLENPFKNEKSKAPRGFFIDDSKPGTLYPNFAEIERRKDKYSEEKYSELDIVDKHRRFVESKMH
ncbi:hypothetical protein AB4Z45_27790 [Paenibacillus sp. MCAF9]|uniref:hypothetical protein n=1 Tax=Paenibacillus sp. MCAF9 TaxID=3233046 RepID=UPI003F9502F9